MKHGLVLEGGAMRGLFTAGGGDRRYLDNLYPPWGYGGVKSGISYVQLSGKLSYWFNDHF